MPTLEDYRVHLEAYSGPLDLLLFLVKRHEIDLNDIPVARLTDQYLQHLRLIEQIDVNLAGDFLVMAATLLEIKSQMLLPRPEAAEEEADQGGALDDLDPRHELVQQLLAYKRFKDAAELLEERQTQWQSRYPARPARKPRSRPGEQAEGDAEEGVAEEVEIFLDDANVLDLCEAFANILDSIGSVPATHDVTYDDTPIELHEEDIVDRLARDGRMTLQAMFVGRRSRSEMIGLFLATLELVRQKKVRVVQETATGQIHLDLRPEAEVLGGDQDEATDWRDPETGEMQYDWPSEEDRLRAERRAHLRALYAAKRAAGEAVEGEDEFAEFEDEEEAEIGD